MAETSEAATKERIAGFIDRAMSIAGGHVDEGAPAEPDILPWQPFRQGVELITLGPTDGGPTVVLLRYAAAATVPHHTHPWNEYILVLNGAQDDERGHYPRGSFVHNAPGSSHAVASSAGCLVAIIWEKPVIFSPEHRSD